MPESHLEPANTRADRVNDKARWVLPALVGNIDPARMTRLTLRYQDKQRTISLYNLAATNKM